MTDAPTETEKVDELIEAADPPVKKRPQRILAGADSPYVGFDRTYTQQKLSFFGKLEFLRLTSKAIDKAMSGQEGDAVKLTDLMGVDSMSDLATADVFLRAIVRLAEHAPELLKEIYMISLNVPGHERPALVGTEEMPGILDEPHDEDDGSGGLSDDDGFEILTTFIAQNARVMRDFYREKAPQIVELVQKAMATDTPDQTPAQSKPSKRSARSMR